MATGSSAMKRPPADELDPNDPKRARSNDGTPVPPTAAASTSTNDILAAARARLQAKMQAATPAPSKPAEPASTPAPAVNASAAERIAAMKARIAAATALKSQPSAPTRPTPSPAPRSQEPSHEQPAQSGRGGLDIGLHPALMGDSAAASKGPRAGQAMQPKFATTKANQRAGNVVQADRQLDLSAPNPTETRQNPYFDMSFGPQTATLRQRQSRQLIFNQKGKYIAQATALRRQAQLEEMKARIAASSRKAGIDEDNDLDKAFLVPEPPEIEWWDEGLVTEGANYNDLQDPAKLKIDTEDSIITIYVQHPVLLQAPQEKMMPAPKPMFLTAKERKKVRRQTRKEELQESQAKVRLGLEPPAPPKIKRSNLMRVLGDEAVKDPTAVEARVNAEIEARAQNHENTNLARKLDKDERGEKLARQQEEDAKRGIQCQIYRIDSLVNGKNRFKISRNAEQQALTGVCILNPKFCLVVVEGGSHSALAYKKLMMNRIQWTENEPSRNRNEGQGQITNGHDKKDDEPREWMNSEDADGKLKDLSENKCQLVWEGQLKNRGFRKWNIRVTSTDAEAREVLAKSKMEAFWAQAKALSNTNV